MNKDNTFREDKQKGADANRDPITDAPGAHPVGTGAGAAGGAAAGAAIGALGGPVGAGVGLVVGAVAGGLTGKGVAEKMDPTVEDEYWKTNYSRQKYVEADAPYEDYQLAYRTGYEGRSRYPGKKFEEVEPELRCNYEQEKGDESVSWDKARNAARDAWLRVERALPDDADGDGR